MSALPAPAARRLREWGRQARVPALVLDCSFVNGLTAIRQLARAGIPAVAIDHRPQALGLRSRMGMPLRCPDPGVDRAGYAALLADIVEAAGGRAVALPTHDDHLAAAAAAGIPGLVPTSGPADLVPAMEAKRHQLEAAARAGVPIPRTWYPATEEEARAAAAEVRYPAVMKPSRGAGFKRRHGRQLIEARDPGELVAAWRAGRDDEPMLQERVAGGDDALWTVGSYVDRSGRPLGVFCGRKLLQMPRGAGTCRVGEARWDGAAVAHALALLRELGYHGVSQVEFKRDPRDGELRLMEVNARLWQWHSLAAACGVDLPVIAYRDAVGDAPAPAGQRRGRRRWVVLVSHLRHSRREGLSLRETLAPLRPPITEAVISVRDPLPGLHQAWGALRAR